MSQYHDRYDVPSWREVENVIRRLEVGPVEANGMRFYYLWARARQFMVRPRIHFGDSPVSFWDVVKLGICFVLVTVLVIGWMAL